MGSILYGNAIHIREQAKIDAARITRASGNERRGAESELQRFSSALGNQRTMDAAGRNVNNPTENISRNLDAATYGNFGNRVAAAEELGAATALAATSGMSGSSVEAYNQTVRLSSAMAEEQNMRGVNTDLIHASDQRGQLISDAVANFDNNKYNADLDFTINVDHQKQSTLTKLFTLGAAAAATYFTGSPQAGMAIIGLSESGQAANNGDFATASSEAMGAMRNGFGAADDYNKTRGGPAKNNGGAKSATGTWSSVEHTAYSNPRNNWAAPNSIRLH